ncbi:hypothetical protein BGW36DRAFT_391238 [Talaromyces proteolyticus]|uniref:rRNA biogenesis protein RRP36 n=1 Tax=Talaromyces proteolyticus TaxID=1131652 RepID=A0AAD4PUQ3_9EURO|nr:uncharacterized protein BGW36DRAFT_391238 [Talaromyces proteolyticus]KAH8689625.1 hypothetical protein BGW36DRAFT_391238 [Talaromyces proteolyticus]
MGISESMNRHVRARYEDDDEQEEFSSEGDEDVDGGLSDADDASGDEIDNESENDSESQSESDKEDIQSQIRQVSFGALAKAQASLGKRKRDHTTTTSSSQDASSSTTLDSIREQLRKAREQKEQGSSHKHNSKPAARSSKHAPTVQSSKYAVSRKRIVVEPPNSVKARDPRFDPTVMSTSSAQRNSNAEATNRAYSFLDEYRSAELKQLREEMVRTKDAAQKEKLKRAITSATDRQRTMQNRKREREVLSEHRKRERQLLREGKKSQPYYLKKSELKREVLKKKYEGMKSKERAKALERRRKKVAGKEKKELPWSRRGLESSS